MVKPPKRMEPESVELSKAGRSTSKSFDADSFSNYISRKIHLQRKEKGCALPPDPRQKHVEEASPEIKTKAVRFAPDVVIKERTASRNKAKRCQDEPALSDLVKRLKVQHGSGYSARQNGVDGDRRSHELVTVIESSQPKRSATVEGSPDTSGNTITTRQSTDRPDLFFLGVVILVNGYTYPDAETLHRVLHRHGGDLEKYETSRVTHIIAENLSAAKANVYKQRTRPRPICKPSWIVDSVAAQKLLPYQDYLLDDVRKDESMGRPLTSYFTKQSSSEKSPSASSSTSLDLNELNESAKVSARSGRSALPGATSSATPTHRSTLIADATVCLDALKQCSSPENNHLGSTLSQSATDSEATSNVSLDPEQLTAAASPSTASQSNIGRTDDKYIHGRIRTIGTDPYFLESFFNSSRLSFIGSYKQRVKTSPTKNAATLTKHKTRYVMHIDMDSFFVAVALRSFPQFKTRPVVISHHGMRKNDAPPQDATHGNDSTSECATCNYEARNFGITKGMYLGQAKQLCKDLVVLDYDFEGFEEVSTQVSEILDRHAIANDGCVEQVSCDESYLEIFVDKNQKALIEDIGHRIRREIFETAKCTASVGIGPNKLLAKIATDKVKPDGLLCADNYRELLRDLRLRDLHGIGYRLEQKLSAEGLEFVQDVWSSTKADLIRVLGKATGSKVFDLCHGEDDRCVESAERKSIGAEVRTRQFIIFVFVAELTRPLVVQLWRPVQRTLRS